MVRILAEIADTWYGFFPIALLYIINLIAVAQQLVIVEVAKDWSRGVFNCAVWGSLWPRNERGLLLRRLCDKTLKGEFANLQAKIVIGDRKRRSKWIKRQVLYRGICRVCIVILRLRVGQHFAIDRILPGDCVRNTLEM